MELEPIAHGMEEAHCDSVSTISVSPAYPRVYEVHRPRPKQPLRLQNGSGMDWNPGPALDTCNDY